MTNDDKQVFTWIEDPYEVAVRGYTTALYLNNETGDYELHFSCEGKPCDSTYVQTFTVIDQYNKFIATASEGLTSPSSAQGLLNLLRCVGILEKPENRFG